MIARQIENNPTSNGDVPVQPVVIADCGVLSPDDPSLSQKQSDGDVYEDYPDDEDRELGNPETVLQMAKVIREVGNELFKKGDFNGALQKYKSRSSRSGIRKDSHGCLCVESVRYLDLHQNLPENTPSGVREGYSALLAPLLLNSALAAIRIQPPNTDIAVQAIGDTTRALESLQLNKADQGNKKNVVAYQT